MKTKDQPIETNILNRIRRDSRINDAMIKVKVNNGLVVLTGIVSTYKKKLAVQLKAKQTHGVLSVDNQIEVHYHREFGNPPGDMIKKTAESILAAASDIDASKITIKLNSGVLTLKGSVTWFWQLHRIDELVSNIIGVIDVKNELTVVPSEKISDEIIALEITKELEHADHIDPSQILIEVKHGTVILSGTLRTYAAEQEAYDATIQQAGVTKIVNNITIATPKT
jgi:osmotically-inducible protein OsmY